jgi:hypothetical protein
MNEALWGAVGPLIERFRISLMADRTGTNGWGAALPDRLSVLGGDDENPLAVVCRLLIEADKKGILPKGE